MWDRATGEPVYNAIVWQDTRTGEFCEQLDAEHGDMFRKRTGLPVSTYFAGPKIRWILDNVEGVRERAERGELAFGTMDTWVVWELTRSSRRGRGPSGGRRGQARHVTDVTNASRTMLMNLRTQQWDPELCEAMGVPMSLPRSSVPRRFSARWSGPGGAQGADRRHPRRPTGATFCRARQAKCTYGTETSC